MFHILLFIAAIFASAPLQCLKNPKGITFEEYLAAKGDVKIKFQSNTLFFDNPAEIHLYRKNLTDLNGLEKVLLDKNLKLHQVVMLDLSYNKLTQVPEIIRSMNHLETLNLSHNRLQKLPDWIGDIRRLTTLNVSDNDIKSLPHTLQKLEKLSTFEYSNNPIVLVSSPYQIRTKYFPRHQVGEIKLSGDLTSFFLIFSAIDQGKTATVTSIARMAKNKGLSLDNTRDDEGNTPLHRAVLARIKSHVRQRDPNYEAIKALLAFGSSKSTKNNAGETPVDLARHIPQVLDILLQASDFPGSGFPSTPTPGAITNVND